MRRFVIGDIHGAYKALMQCLNRSGFDYNQDLLISLGDVCDGWPETRQCLDELLKVENLIMVRGNHDQWVLEWMEEDIKTNGWLSQGGRQTMESYGNEAPSETHVQLLKNSPLYHLTDDNRLFVHAGIDITKPLEEQDEFTLMWRREFYNEVVQHLERKTDFRFTEYGEVYIGHSPISRLGFYNPVKVGEVWLMDTGAAWDGVLSIMDIDTKEIFTSDKPEELYPEGSGRG